MAFILIFAAHDRSIANQRTSTPGGTLEIERLLQSTDYRSDELEDILKLRRGEEANIRSFRQIFLANGALCIPEAPFLHKCQNALNKKRT
jgi:hypothetical protein